MKSPFLRSILTVGVVALFVTASPAQEVSKKEKLASDLLDQLQLQKTMDGAFDSATKMQEQMMASQKMSPEEIEKSRKRMQASMEATKKALGWDSLKPIFVKIYADNFDEADLEGMIAFYKTPVGQKWIQKQPQLQAATMQAMGQIMPKIQAAVMESFKDSDSSDAKSTP